jgi:hypothetical protein
MISDKVLAVNVVKLCGGDFISVLAESKWVSLRLRSLHTPGKTSEPME